MFRPRATVPVGNPRVGAAKVAFAVSMAVAFGWLEFAAAQRWALPFMTSGMTAGYLTKVRAAPNAFHRALGVAGVLVLQPTGGLVREYYLVEGRTKLSRLGWRCLRVISSSGTEEGLATAFALMNGAIWVVCIAALSFLAAWLRRRQRPSAAARGQ
jgi:hypothetical protein